MWNQKKKEVGDLREGKKCAEGQRVNRTKNNILAHIFWSIA